MFTGNRTRSLNFKRDGECLWKFKGRECLDEEFGSGGGGGSNGENNGTGNKKFGGESPPDRDFYKDFQKRLSHTMDISIARSTINLYL